MGVSDVIVDCLYEENLALVLQTLPMGRLMMDSEDQEEPFLLGEEEYLVVRVVNADPHAFARALESRVPYLRIVEIKQRTPPTGDDVADPVPGSAHAQRQLGILDRRP